MNFVSSYRLRRASDPHHPKQPALYLSSTSSNSRCETSASPVGSKDNLRPGDFLKHLALVHIILGLKPGSIYANQFPVRLVLTQFDYAILFRDLLDASKNRVLFYVLEKLRGH